MFGEKHELDKHVDNHKPTLETSSGGGDNVLVDYLRRVAVQQELIITKLNKLETKMDGEFIDIRNYLHGDKTKATVDASTNTENLNDNGTRKKAEHLQTFNSPSSELPASTASTTRPSVPQPPAPAPSPS